jgi:hypothetical protein
MVAKQVKRSKEFITRQTGQFKIPPIDAFGLFCRRRAQPLHFI